MIGAAVDTMKHSNFIWHFVAKFFAVRAATCLYVKYLGWDTWYMILKAKPLFQPAVQAVRLTQSAIGRYATWFSNEDDEQQ